MQRRTHGDVCGHDNFIDGLLSLSGDMYSQTFYFKNSTARQLDADVLLVNLLQETGERLSGEVQTAFSFET